MSGARSYHPGLNVLEREDDSAPDPSCTVTCPTCGGDGDRRNPEGSCIRCQGWGVVAPDELTAAERDELEPEAVS